MCFLEKGLHGSLQTGTTRQTSLIDWNQEVEKGGLIGGKTNAEGERVSKITNNESVEGMRNVKTARGVLSHYLGSRRH